MSDNRLFKKKFWGTQSKSAIFKKPFDVIPDLKEMLYILALRQETSNT